MIISSYFLVFLHRRLGQLPEGSEARIAALPLARIEALAEALLEFSAMGDLTAWLARESQS